MMQRLKENWQGYLILGIIGIWIVAFFSVLSSTRNCPQNIPMWQAQGLCVWRGVAEISCILGIELVFGVGAGIQTKAKGYGFLLGFLLGFFGSVMGGFLALVLSPKSPKGTNRAPIDPAMMKRRVIVLAIIIITILFGILLALRNTGRL